jgi:putative redox protein
MSITATSASNYQVNISAGKHQLVSDEPLGTGDDAGPCPFDLLLSALASCMIITVQMYARRKNWALDSIQLTSQIESRDEIQADGGKKRSSVINNQISFVGNLDPSQIKRLTEIAGRCPIHRSLKGEFSIYTEAVDTNRN